MKTIFNSEFTYRAQGGDLSRCQLEVTRNGEKALVIATELRRNPGMSITNSSEYLATQVVSQFGLDPEKTTFIEHYNAKISYGASKMPLDAHGETDTYSIVTYTWQDKTAKRPQWKYIKEAEFEALT